MSVKRRDLVRHLEQNGFYLLREGANHSIYTNGTKVIPVKRHLRLLISDTTRTFKDCFGDIVACHVECHVG